MLLKGSFIYLVLYVDYMLLVAEKKSYIQKLKGILSTKFEMKDLGRAKKILGMEIQKDRRKGTICLTQTQYFEENSTEIWGRW